jgi:AraC-like DNA-binding protein
VRGGPDHYIGHEPGANCLEPEEFRARHAHADPGDNPRATVFLCGTYQFSGDVGGGLLDALPPVMTLSAAIDDPLRDVIALLSRELVRTEPTQQIVLDRLLDLLLVLAIRSDFRHSATRAGDLNLAQIADATGYGSPFAFAAAFRRHHGDPPGTWRQRERAAADTRILPAMPGGLPVAAGPRTAVPAS